MCLSCCVPCWRLLLLCGCVCLVDGWRCDLTQCGDVESNPGPKLVVLSANVGGRAGLFRLMDCLPLSDPDVVCVQEHRLEDRSASDFVSFASRAGFVAYVSAFSGKRRTGGGVLVLGCGR